MKQYRFKNEKEMERDFGKDWRQKQNRDPNQDVVLGQLCAPQVNLILNDLESAGRLPGTVKEIPQLSCDIERTHFDDEKRKVTVVLRNGNVGRSVCSPEDTYDPYVGFAIAYARAVAGSNTKFREYVNLKMQRQNRKSK